MPTNNHGKITKTAAYSGVQSGTDGTVALLNRLGWRVWVKVDARKATVTVHTERRYLRQVRSWFEHTLTDGMALVCKPLSLKSRFQTRTVPVVVELCGF